MVLDQYKLHKKRIHPSLADAFKPSYKVLRALYELNDLYPEELEGFTPKEIIETIEEIYSKKFSKRYLHKLLKKLVNESSLVKIEKHGHYNLMEGVGEVIQGEIKSQKEIQIATSKSYEHYYEVKAIIDIPANNFFEAVAFIVITEDLKNIGFSSLDPEYDKKGKKIVFWQFVNEFTDFAKIEVFFIRTNIEDLKKLSRTVKEDLIEIAVHIHLKDKHFLLDHNKVNFINFQNKKNKEKISIFDIIEDEKPDEEQMLKYITYFIFSQVIHILSNRFSGVNFLKIKDTETYKEGFVMFNKFQENDDS